jgi:hypothetical protein
MDEIVFDRTGFNPELLSQELFDALGESLSGVSWDDQIIRIHLLTMGTPEVIRAIDMARAAHDPSLLTREQQKQGQLDSDRASFADSIDPVTATLAELAERLAWLEREIRDLRGLR